MKKILRQKNRAGKTLFSSFFNFLTFFIFISLLISSCSVSSIKIQYKLDKNIKDSLLYNIEFNSPMDNPYKPMSMMSSIVCNKPQYIDSCGTKMICCIPAAWPKAGLFYVKQSNVKRITTMANPQKPPKIVEKIDTALSECDSCSRDRSGLLFEIKAMGGIRRDPWAWGNTELTSYPDSVYTQGDFSTGVGGSKIVIGGEISLVSGFNFIDNLFKWLDKTPSSMKIGLMTGVWPVDGSLFVPAALRMRYTTNVVSKYHSCYPGSCDSWFFFLDVGSPISLNSQTKKIGYFGDVGVGIDLNLGRNIDFSVDCGFRIIKTPLPELIAPPECKEAFDLNPTRTSRNFILRFGLTF